MAGRKPKNQEFLRTLREALATNGQGLAKAIGKKTTNVSQYLSGAKRPGDLVIHSAVAHLSEWRVRPVYQVEKIPDRISDLPNGGGIYALYDSGGNLLYLGQAKNLRTEVSQTLNRRTNFPVRRAPNLSKKSKPKYKFLASYLSVYEVPSTRLRHNLEALLLRVFPNQSHNNKLGTFR